MLAHQIQVPNGNKVGIAIQCPNILCQGRDWNYAGNRTVYATCPNCKKPVRIEDHRVKIKENNPGPKIPQSKTRISSSLIGVETP
jgi:hypothetical protein